jgi:hypothetical protein
MSDQTAQYFRDPNWGGCPYWSCNKDSDSLVRVRVWYLRLTSYYLLKSSQVIFEIKDPWNDKW